MIQELTREDVADILYGATVFGAGGGGALSEGFALIDLAVAAGKKFRMAGLDDVPDDALLCMPYLLGAVSDLPSVADALHHKPHPLMRAFARVKEYANQPIFGALACELGGSNTAVPFFVAAMSDCVVIDGDPAGRAVPEITHSAFALAGVPPAPIFAANAFGETIVLNDVATDQRAEDLVRILAQASGNDISAIDHVLSASTLRPHLVPGTLSTAWKIGALMRDMAHCPPDLVDQIADIAGGTVLFAGRVRDSHYATQDGFTVGRFTITGTGDHEGQTFWVDVKNENMVGWLDDTPAVTVPEIITVIDAHTGEVVLNPDVCTGQDIIILILPAPPVFVTKKGLAAFGPAYLGLTQTFKPVT